MTVAEKIRKEKINFWTYATVEEMAEELIVKNEDTASEGTEYFTTDGASFWSSWGPKISPDGEDKAIAHQIALLKASCEQSLC